MPRFALILQIAISSFVYMLLLVTTGSAITPLFAQAVPHQWDAQWIAAPDAPARDPSVVYFRKELLLTAVPSHFVVDVSGDTRYELHINGQRISAGPALADVHHWRYEVVDLAPYLHTGSNTIAAIVWNFGTAAAIAQMSSQTAFLLRAEDPANAAVNTGEGWQSSQERGRSPTQLAMDGYYYAAGPPESMDGRLMQWHWDEASSTEGNWLAARPLGHAAPAGTIDSATRWILQKDELPPMQYSLVPAGHVVRATGIQNASLDQPLTIPPHSSVALLLDRKVLTTAFPSLRLKGGKDAAVSLTYAEALYDDHGHKGNRDEIAGRHIQGVTDEIVSDGAERSYRTLWWRTWRYLQIEIKTSDTPLTIEGIDADYTAYPFQKIAGFASDQPDLARIWDTGWRTAQLCAHETYMDTPYWEQLQYVGDTRIQALISYAVTGDDRLARQAMMAYRDSLLTDGLTQSRYPSSLTQVIPPFSLMWIGMLHDYSMYRDDPKFLASLLPGTRGVLDWFSAHQRSDGLLGRIEWWPFVDWTEQYPGGSPPQQADGGSSALTLQYIEGLNDAAELEQRLGEPERAERYRVRAKQAADGLMRLNWDAKTGLLADTPEKSAYSQEANALAVWLDVVPKEQQRDVVTKLLSKTTNIAQASYYFRFYLARAMVHAGLGDDYIAQLDPWRKMLALGLSTWAEQPEPTRSDSHAWSAHPTYDLLTIVAGIAPASPGFQSVVIAPHLANLNQASATMPSPRGLIEVSYRKSQDEWTADVTLPEGLPGQLEWSGKTIPLRAGKQEISLR